MAALSGEHQRAAKTNPPSDSTRSDQPPPCAQAYQAQFEGFLHGFLDEVGATTEQFLVSAKGASGMNDIYLEIFLAQSDYEGFVELMTEEVQKQQSRAEALDDEADKGLANLSVGDPPA